MQLRPPTKLRIAVLAAALVVLELACRVGLIRRFTMIPPSEMASTLVQLMVSGVVASDMRQTLTCVTIALGSAVLVGFITGAILHAWPRVRRVMDPLLATYYSVPVFVFYPLFIVLFGLTAVPKTIIGFLYAFVAMIINTLNGLDRVPAVLLKTAKVHHLGRAATLRRIVFPYAAPYVFTGVKLAVAYSFIGVIGSEFILSTGGLGYRISFSYNNFQSDVMYALILFVLIIAVAINMVLYAWERVLLERRGSR
jgi:NitT/TauT family transport system permease protein